MGWPSARGWSYRSDVDIWVIAYGVCYRVMPLACPECVWFPLRRSYTIGGRILHDVAYVWFKASLQ
jgi:hypothetical protein